MAEDNKKKTTTRKKKVEKVVEKKPEKKEVVKEETVKEEPKKVVKDNNGFKLWEVMVVMVVTALFGLFIGSYITYNRYNGRKVSCGAVREDMEELTSIYDDIVNDFYGEVDKEAVLNSAIAAMVYSLDDKYSAFIDNSAASSLDEELKGKFVGLGVQVSSNEEGQIVVVAVFDNSPAAKAGIKPLDIIAKVDSKDYNANNLEEMTSYIKSSKVGDKKNFEVIRDNETLNLEITMEEVEIKSVNSYYVERNGNNIGIVIISNFAGNTYDQLVREYNELKKNNIKALVVDLRGNGGGYLTSAKDVSSLFLDKGMIIFEKTDGEKVETIKSRDEKLIDVPVVLLVDGTTASGSEVVVSSLRNNLNCEIVGIKTYGKGMIQKLQDLGNNKFVKYSVQEWRTSTGQQVEGIGISPTIEVEYDVSLGYDNQLEVAIDTASKK